MNKSDYMITFDTTSFSRLSKIYC